MEERPITQPGAATVTGYPVTQPQEFVARLLTRLELQGHPVRFALGVFVLSRLGFVLLTVIVLAVAHTPLTPYALVHAWYHRDAVAYAHVATNGYQPGPSISNTAFFPLQPLLMHVIAPLVGGDIALAGLVVANLSYALALLGIAALATRDADAATARRAMLYLTLFPTALFFFAGYSESLFLALSVWSFVCLRRGWWWRAGAFGLLAALTRQAGVLLMLPFAWEYGSRVGWHLRKMRASALAIGLMPLGTLLFMAWLWHAVGDPLALVYAQRYWARSFAFPWSTLHHAIVSLPHQGDAVLVLRGSIDLAAVLLMGALLVYGARRMRVGDTLYVTTLWLLPLFSPSAWWPLLSNARFMILAFPAFILLAREGQRPWLNVLVLAVFSLLLVVMAWLFASGNPQIL